MTQRVGFSGYSISEIESYTENLRFFKFLEYVGGHAELRDELSFRAKFRNEGDLRILLNTVEASSEKIQKTQDLQVTASPVRSAPSHLIQVTLTRMSPGFLEERHFRSAEMLEFELEPLLSKLAPEILPPHQFDTRGFKAKASK